MGTGTWIIFQIAIIAAKATWSDMGTNGLGWVLLFAIPCGVALMRAYRAPKNERLAAIRSQWRAELRDVFLVTFLVGTVIFAFEALWNQPHKIWVQAASVQVPQLKPDLPSPREPISAIPRKGLAKQSRLEVTNIVGVPAQDASHRPGFFLNVFYANKGDIPATIAVHRTILLTSSVPLTSEQEVDNEKTALKIQSPGSETPRHDIQPGEPPRHFFTAPTDDGQAFQLGTIAPDVLAGKTRLYLYVVFKYRDEALSKKQIRITEFCAAFYRTFDMWYNCGVSRIYTAPDN